MIKILKAKESSYYVAPQDIFKELEDALVEAQDIDLYLRPVEKYVQLFWEMDFPKICNLFPHFFHTICLICSHSKFYSTPSIVVLLQEFCNLLIDQIASRETEEALEHVKIAKTALKRFKDLFLSHKNSLEIYFACGKEFKPWDFRYEMLFSRSDMFLNCLLKIEEFEGDYAELKAKTMVLDRCLATVLCVAFNDCSGLESVFKIFSPNYNILLEMFDKELNNCKHIHDECIKRCKKGNEIINKNMPITSGGLKWSKELKERIQTFWSYFLSLPHVEFHLQLMLQLAMLATAEIRYLGFIGNLELVVQLYNRLMQTTLEVEYPLTKELRIIDDQLKEAEEICKWQATACWDCSRQVKISVCDLEQRVQQSKDNVRSIQGIMNAWLEHALFSRKSEKEALLYLDDKGERLAKIYRMLQEDSLTDFKKFITVIDAGLQDVTEGDSCVLVEIMGHLLAVKERHTTPDELFEPLKEVAALLESYGQKMLGEVYAQLEPAIKPELPQKWNAVKKRDVSVKHKVTSLQVAIIRRKCALLDARLKIIDDWTKTQWRQINVEQMDVELKRFAKDVYRGLELKVKNLMLLSLRAILELQNPAVRRHWYQVRLLENEVQSIVHNAVKELGTEKILAEISQTWAAIEFSYEEHHRNRAPLFKSNEQLLETLNNSQVQLQKIVKSKYVAYFIEQKEFTLTLKRSEASCLKMQTDLVKSIETSKLSLCEKALAEYLETKCIAFPCFYFVSSADLLDILSKGKQPKEVARHLTKLFDNNADLKFQENREESINAALGMYSREKEHIALHDDEQKNFRLSYLELEDMRLPIMEVILAYEENRENWGFDYPAQAALTASRIRWVSDVEIAFSRLEEGLASVRKDCHKKQCDAQFQYFYEYLGNTPWLVITPLTDRCYITLTQSLHLTMSSASAGPAGTGKTETTKDLGHALGVMVYVFNCSKQMDYKFIGNIFKGLVQTGAWGRFDFNHISVEVLLVVAVQVKTIHYALRNKKKKFLFIGGNIPADDFNVIFITKNPGYVGQTELPENLKALFRPCAMIVPDIELISEIMLVPEGFIDACLLARKFITLYTPCRELLSKQVNYDGLRAIKSVLVVAGSLKEDKNRPEDEVLMALRDINLPKIVTDDVPVFTGLISDLFPALDVPRKRNLKFEQMAKQSTLELFLQPEESFIHKVVQGEELLAVHYSVFVIGNAGTGKSKVLKVLHHTYLNMKQKPVWNDLNLKALTADELFGFTHHATQEWKDGLLSSLLREQADITHEGPKWLVLDGDTDPVWIESLNTVIDDNKVLTITSNERVPLTPSMQLLFEVHHLRAATPATVSRAGILYLNTQDLEWNPFKSTGRYVLQLEEEENLLHMLGKKLEKKAGHSYGPVGNKKLTYFINDLNMPEVDRYGTVQAHALIRQHKDYGHWYDRQKLRIKEIHNCQSIACMNPSAGTFTISPRLPGMNVEDQVLLQSPLIYCHFANGRADPCYKPVKGWESLRNIPEEFLESYNEMHASMNLDLFDSAVQHVCQISHILEASRGYALLIGVGGSCKQSFSRLAAYICSLEVFQITLKKDYGMQDLRVDLASLYIKTGAKNMPTVFLLTDAQVPDERFLVLINDLLASGDVPDLFGDKDVENIVTGVRKEVQALGLMDTESCCRFFLSRVQLQLKMILCFSPASATLQTRARKFPAIVNSTAIDWFHEWPQEDTICDFMVYAHTGVNTLSAKYNCNERYNYITLKNFLEQIMLYKILLEKKSKEMLGHMEHLVNGMRKMKAADFQVEDLKSKLASQEAELLRNQDAEALIAKIGFQTEEVSQEKAIADAEEQKVSSSSPRRSISENDCEDDPLKAEPALVAATAALDMLNKVNLTELKAFINPPMAVTNVIAALMVLLADKGKVPEDRSWKAAKVFTGKVDDFLQALINYDKEHIPQNCLKVVEEHYLKDTDFNPNYFHTKYFAAAGLCAWVINIVKFNEVYCEVEPKHCPLAQANAELAAATEKLEAIKKKLLVLDKNLRKLTASLEKEFAEKVQCQDDVNRTNKITKLANRLVRGLEIKRSVTSKFFRRWGRAEKRREMHLGSDDKKVPITVTEDLDPIAMLTDDATIAAWSNEGLPGDRMSTENVTVLTNCECWPLMIDPQQQGIKWIKNKYEADLKVVHLGQKGFLKTIETGLASGETVLIENMDESIDPILDPLLGRHTVKKAKYIKIEDKECEFNKNFHLILHTKLANPHCKPELQALTTLINFTVTRNGLKDQLLAEIVSAERPDLEKCKSILAKQQNHFKTELRQLEDDMLISLSAAGSFLDDSELVEKLESTKSTAVEIQHKIAEAKENKAQINVTREHYRPTAIRASVLYFISNSPSHRVRNFVEEKLGSRYVERTRMDLAKSYEESSPASPVFFILPPGADPLEDIETLGKLLICFWCKGKKIGFTLDSGRFHIALGQGQEMVAEEALEKAARHGHRVLLKNIHLVAKWPGTLQKKLLKQYSEESHPDFHVFISAEPALTPEQHIIPQGILENSIKITSKPPMGTVADLHAALCNFDQDTPELCTTKGEFKSIFFSLCYFHTCVAGRLKFGPQGWNGRYLFSARDLTVCIHLLCNYLETHKEARSSGQVPQEDLCYLFGEIIYSGHITDVWDSRLCCVYLEFISPPVVIMSTVCAKPLNNNTPSRTAVVAHVLLGWGFSLKGELALAPGFLAPPNLHYAGYHKYIDMLPSESPVLYGLHPNAEMGYLTTTSDNLFKTLLEMQPMNSFVGERSGQSAEEKVKNALDDILERLPEEFNMAEIMQKTTAWSPYALVCLQECERMNLLLQRSLKQLDLDLKGELFSLHMEVLQSALFYDAVPDTWTKLAYPSTYSLDHWVTHLLMQYGELEIWTQDLVLPTVVWLSGLFNPQSFLTGARTWRLILGTIAEVWLKELTPAMPVIFVRAIPADQRESKYVYECPVYKTKSRGPTYIWTFNLKSTERPAKWVLAGVALLLAV
ncbi:LOW QUALITY PROTEIN: dynein axonemal heavy chain 11 [Podargus strigoides]